MAKKIQMSFLTRLGLLLATRVAEKIAGEAVLLSMQPEKNRFRFEGGTVVDVDWIDIDQYAGRGEWSDWAVRSLTVKYREWDRRHEVIWDGPQIVRELGDRLPHRPYVLRDVREVQGWVGVFWDNAAADGFVRVDPDQPWRGHSTQVDCVEYSPLVPGDRERAVEEAKQRLARL